MRKILLIAFSGPLLFMACKKKETASSLTKSEMLSNGKWKISELKFSNAGGEQDLLDITADCDKDNFYLFNTDKSITADEGATKCNESDAQTTTDGQWLLESNDTKLTFKESAIFGTTSNITLNVVSISAQAIQFSKDSSIVVPGVGTFDGQFIGTFSNIK